MPKWLGEHRQRGGVLRAIANLLAAPILVVGVLTLIMLVIASSSQACPSGGAPTKEAVAQNATRAPAVAKQQIQSQTALALIELAIQSVSDWPSGPHASDSTCGACPCCAACHAAVIAEAQRPSARPPHPYFPHRQPPLQPAGLDPLLRPPRAAL
jgi:hypothetical protein